MIKLLKRIMLILLLSIIDIITFIVKIVYDFFQKNENKIHRYTKGFYEVLKEEIQK